MENERDVDLEIRLRSEACLQGPYLKSLMAEAARRIEELEAKLARSCVFSVSKLIARQAERIEELEAALAKERTRTVAAWREEVGSPELSDKEREILLPHKGEPDGE